MNDGFNETNGEVDVTVSPPPPVNLGPDRNACPYDTITIEAGVPGETYYWSNGSTGESIKVGTTGIGFDVKKIWLEVTNENGCTAVDTLLIYFDFANCFGINEYGSPARMAIYPNPTFGSFNLDVEGLSGKATLEIKSLDGRNIYDKTMDINPDGTYQDVINLASYPRGIYFLKITAQNELLVSKIILK